MRTKDYFLTKENFTIKPSQIEGILETYPLPNDLDRYYKSENYISHHQDNQTIKQKIFKFFQKFNLNYKRNCVAKETFKKAKILDYGCGVGDFLHYIEDDFTTIGYEPNSEALKIATQKSSSTLFINSLSDIENESLDVITLWHVFEHIVNRDIVLEEFYSKLTKGGKLIIAVPNYKSYDAQYYKKYWAAYDVPRHVYHYSKIGMENLFKEKKWDMIDYKPLLLDAPYISILSEKYKKNPLNLVFGSILGTISNIKASKTGEYSSLVCIIEKK